MSVNYGIGLVVLYLFDKLWKLDAGIPEISARSVHRWSAGVLVCLGAWIALSLVLLNTSATDTTSVRAAALHYDAGVPWSGVERFGDLTRQAAPQGAQVIVWPETAIEDDPRVTNTAEFRQLAAETNAYLALGYFVEVNGKGWRNEVTVLAPEGRFLGVYGKD